MRETSYILSTQRRNALGRIESVTHEWRGTSPYVRISRDLLDQVTHNEGDERVQIGPYILLKVEDQFWDASVLYVRADRLGALRVALYKATRLADLVYRRLIITLAVWRLADYHQAAVPTWKDIHLVKRFLK
jgi:hypothetical protein